ncbi:MAG: ATP synthase F1 subunit delta [Bacteroidota bacterium]
MIVASRYAKSLVDLALEKGILDTIYKDIVYIEAISNQSKEFKQFLHSPVINSDKKTITLKAIFEGKLNPITSAFIALIASKRRENLIPQIAASFIEQYRIQKNILTAVVTSANGLDDVTKKKALELVKSQLNGEVELVEKIDPNIIGGFILKIGDKQLDKSVSRQLANFKKEFTNKALN